MCLHLIMKNYSTIRKEITTTRILVYPVKVTNHTEIKNYLVWSLIVVYYLMVKYEIIYSFDIEPLLNIAMPVLEDSTLP